MKNNKPSLVFCLLMDAIGLMTYSIPFLGEWADLLWAPVSSLIFFLTFGGVKGAMGGVFNFIEELLPGLDFIPSFTIMYFLQKKSMKSNPPTHGGSESSDDAKTLENRRRIAIRKRLTGLAG